MNALLTTLRQRPAFWLRRVLLTNAGFSAFCTALFLTFPTRMADWTGFAASEIQGLGIELGIFAAFVAWVATRDFGRGWARGLAALVAAGDALWVVASLALAAGIPAGVVDLTTAGRVVVVVQAMIVADFAFFQFFCWRQLAGSRGALADTGEPGRLAA